MEFEFDKEMDSLLRQAGRAGSEAAFSAAQNSKSESRNQQLLHLDADEISLFAENLLSAERRASAMKHLADCPRCRSVLAQFAKINSEFPAQEAATVKTTAVSLPWYKNLFVFPKLGYAMGALALVFSGLIAFFVLQNSRETMNGSVAQIEKTESDSAELLSAPDAEMMANSNTNAAVASSVNSNMTSAILSTNTANASMTNTTAIPKNSLADGTSAKAVTSNANVAAESRGEVSARQVQSLPTAPTITQNLDLASSKKDKMEPPPAPAKPAPRENNYQNDAATAGTARAQNEVTQNSVAQNQQNISPGAQSVRRANTPMSRSAGNSKEEAERSDQRKSRTVIESKTAGGKVFRFADGVWYDAAYNNQRTVNVRRGSEEYKKLDANLRSIANQIGGVVVVVWKGNAYRVQ